MQRIKCSYDVDKMEKWETNVEWDVYLIQDTYNVLRKEPNETCLHCIEKSEFFDSSMTIGRWIEDTHGPCNVELDPTFLCSPATP